MDDNDTISKIRSFYLEERRIPGSYGELAELLQMSRKGAYKVAQKLIEQGVLGKNHDGKMFPKSLFNLPVVGSIKAGYPAGTTPQDESLDVFEFIHDATGNVMFLKVSGDSMKDAAIIDGDYVVVDKSKTPRFGDIVCAYIDSEWTLKYYNMINGKIALIAANDKYDPIYPTTELIIGGNYGGVVTLVMRKPR